MVIGICHSALDPYRLLLLISQILHLLVIIVSTAEALRHSQGNKLLQHNCKEVLLSSWVRRSKHMGKGKQSMAVFELLNPVGPWMLIYFYALLPQQEETRMISIFSLSTENHKLEKCLLVFLFIPFERLWGQNNLSSFELISQALLAERFLIICRQSVFWRLKGT